MSDTSGGLGWWQAGDGKWYPPERHPDPDWRARYPSTAPAPEPDDPGAAKGRPRWLVPVAVIAVAVIVVAATAYLLGQSQGDDGDQTATEGGPITLEAANSAGDNPFTTDLAVKEIAAQPDAIDAVTALRADFETDELTGTLIATGTTPGLYGGTRDDQVCDPDQLADFLTDPANSDKAAAWAKAQNIPTDNIEAFVAALTPVVLTTDTWVTNHGYRDGRATPYQAVLEAGTAVLVDDTGSPRTKCSCGNPLTEARPDGTDPGETTGTPWDGYDPGTTTIVDAGDETDTLTLTDLGTGELFEQPVGGSRPSPPPTTTSTSAPIGTVAPAPASDVPDWPTQGGAGWDGSGCEGLPEDHLEDGWWYGNVPDPPTGSLGGTSILFDVMCIRTHFGPVPGVADSPDVIWSEIENNASTLRAVPIPSDPASVTAYCGAGVAGVSGDAGGQGSDSTPGVIGLWVDPCPLASALAPGPGVGMWIKIVNGQLAQVHDMFEGS